MPDYAITINAAEDAALTIAVARLNAERAAQEPPLGAVNKTQYLTARAKDTLKGIMRQLREDEAPTIKEMYLEASDAQRAAARAALGI